MKLRWLAGLVALALVPVACGSDGDDTSSASGGDAAAFADTVKSSIEAENSKDADAFLALWTDHGLEQYDSGSREEIAAGKGDFGAEEIKVRELGRPEVDGKTATIRVDASVGEEGFVVPLYRVVFSGVLKDGGWKIDGFDFKGSPPPSPDAETVDVTAKDYEFALDRDEVPAGDVAFHFANGGKEQHELTLYKAPDGVTVEAAKAALENVDGSELKDIPDGYQVSHVTFAEVGQKNDVTFAKPVAAGTYVLTCYIPQGGFGDEGPVNPAGIPHIKLGMIKLLTVR